MQEVTISDKLIITDDNGKPTEIWDGQQAPEATKMPKPLETDAPFVRNKKTGVVFPATNSIILHSDLVEPCYNLAGSTNPEDLEVPKASPRLLAKVEEAAKPRDVVADTATIVAAVLDQLGLLPNVRATAMAKAEQITKEVVEADDSSATQQEEAPKTAPPKKPVTGKKGAKQPAKTEVEAVVDPEESSGSWSELEGI